MIFNVDKSFHRSSGIYSISNSIDGRIYIGSTVNFKRRHSDHRNKLKYRNHANGYMQSFSNKYGLDTLSFNLLYLCKEDCLIYNEKLWIELTRPEFNIKPIITRPISDEEVRYNHEQFLKILPTIKTPLCFLIEKYGQEWWNRVCNNNSDSPEEIRRIETGYYSKIKSPLSDIKLT